MKTAARKEKTTRNTDIEFNILLTNCSLSTTGLHRNQTSVIVTLTKMEQSLSRTGSEECSQQANQNARYILAVCAIESVRKCTVYCDITLFSRLNLHLGLHLKKWYRKSGSIPLQKFIIAFVETDSNSSGIRPSVVSVRD